MPHPTVSRQEWNTARLRLLELEKAHTRRGDELARLRRELPWVRIEKPYAFHTEVGDCSLRDLFRGRSQLIVYHLMFGPDYAVPCPSCSSIADSFDGIATHLANHDVMLWAVSRAPLDRICAFKARMGWAFPWASSAPGDFNFDFGASFTPEAQRSGIEYNYQHEPGLPDAASLSGHSALAGVASQAGTDAAAFVRERPGMSAFALQDGVVHHTYSAYSRGLDALWNMYQWLDRAPKGRNEGDGYWLRHRDRY
ncbi:MAG: DUF899 domain-containing protein [Phycisphaeraceae bacterium]|nr:DUF899 domain-containing protein [Phycisphaeraceae bacterium]